MWGQHSASLQADPYCWDIQASSAMTSATAGSNFSSLLLSGSCNAPDSKWQHSASLVQSPLSEGSASSIHSDCSQSPKNQIIYFKSKPDATTPLQKKFTAPFGYDNMDSNSSDWWSCLEQQNFAWPNFYLQAQASSSVNSFSNVEGWVRASGEHVADADINYSTAHVIDDGLQELTLDLCHQGSDSGHQLNSDISAGKFDSFCRIPGILDQQDLLAGGLQDPFCTRLLSAESLFVRTEQVQSWRAPEKRREAKSSNHNFHSMHESNGPLELHHHFGEASDMPVDLGGWRMKDCHAPLSYGGFSMHESNFSKLNHNLLSQIETQPFNIREEANIDDLNRSASVVEQMQGLPLHSLISSNEPSIQLNNPSSKLSDLLSHIFSSCSTSLMSQFGCCISTSTSEHSLHSSASLILSKEQSLARTSSNCMKNYGDAANRSKLDHIGSQIGDSCKINPRLSSSLTNSDQPLEPILKKPRVDLATSLPFKVRTEKLGERITTLQQLVSPFGKTDTASVLLEAIGYIKFLHEQVQVLSMPYMKNSTVPSLQNHESGTKFWNSEKAMDGEGLEQDLQSRGLYLVPLTSTLQIINENSTNY